jgi:DNA-binding transcriptional LysR family regulator
MMPNLYQFNFDLRQLRYFWVIANYLSFRKAAEELHIAQPALSRQIAQLEEVLDCQLFDRQRRQIKLTTAGQYLYETLPSIFDHINNAAGRTNAIGHGKINKLKFGYSSAVMASFLPKIIKKLNTELNNCEYEFVEKTSDKLIQSVLDESLDAAFILYRPDIALLDMLPIKSDGAGVVLPDGHPLTLKQEVKFSDLENETLILFPRDTNPTMYDEIIGQCQKAGFSPKKIIEATPRSVAIAMVAAGQGVATLAAPLEHTCVTGTVYRPLPKTALTVNYSCVALKQRHGQWWDILKDYITSELQ